MRKPVAIAAFHRNGYPREAVRPDAAPYSAFFDLLRAEGCRTQALQSLAGDALAEFGALLRALDAGSARTRAFVYGPRDARILYLTRRVVTLGFDRGAYRALFGTDALGDFAPEFEALAADRLVSVSPERVALTPKGMFYADTVAGLLAWRAVRAREAGRAVASGRLPRPAPSVLYDVNQSAFDPMG